MADFANLKEVYGTVSGPGDAATVLIFGTAGLVIDAALSAHGFLSPGAVGAASASGALGIKKAMEARINKIRDRSVRRPPNPSPYERAWIVLRLLGRKPPTPNVIPAIRRLEGDLQLYDQGLIVADQLNQTVDSIVVDHRDELVEP